MIQALYQILQIRVSWECVSEIQSVKDTTVAINAMCRRVHKCCCSCTFPLLLFSGTAQISQLRKVL